MALHFKSLSSSSAGNCLVLWTDKTRVIIDCGLASMRKTRELLEKNLKGPLNNDSVIISHMHGDHINHHSLRVIEEYGLKLRVHERCLDQLREKHFNGHKFTSLNIKTFSDNCFTVSDLSIQPFQVSHHPSYPNYGFFVRHLDGKNSKNAVIVTDFNNGESALDYMIDADFIFVESNHDLGLLKKYFNPNSRYHMSNPKAAELISKAYMQSKKKPHTVMLGHLSSQRNEEQFAFKEMNSAFRERELDLNFRLFASPLHECSTVVKV
jgi:phosphoribosyl 1,2-cyclic phosphodiesterase